jgi:hypothetical protein
MYIFNNIFTNQNQYHCHLIVYYYRLCNKKGRYNKIDWKFKIRSNYRFLINRVKFDGRVLTNLCMVSSYASQVDIHVSKFFYPFKNLNQYWCNVQEKKVWVFEIILMDLFDKVEKIAMTIHQFDIIQIQCPLWFVFCPTWKTWITRTECKRRTIGKRYIYSCKKEEQGK